MLRQGRGARPRPPPPQSGSLHSALQSRLGQGAAASSTQAHAAKRRHEEESKCFGARALCCFRDSRLLLRCAPDVRRRLLLRPTAEHEHEVRGRRRPPAMDAQMQPRRRRAACGGVLDRPPRPSSGRCSSQGCSIPNAALSLVARRARRSRVRAWCAVCCSPSCVVYRHGHARQGTSSRPPRTTRARCWRCLRRGGLAAHDTNAWLAGRTCTLRRQRKPQLAAGREAAVDVRSRKPHSP
jgi:hypothetical protein